MKSLILAGMLVIAALQSAVEKTTPGSANGGTVEGFVRDSETHKPIEGVTVGLAGHGVTTMDLWKKPSGIRTDASGHFTIRDVSPDTYKVILVKQGYFGAGTILRWGNEALARTITIAPQQHINALILEMTPAATISGRVTGPDGLPLVGVAVSLAEYAYDRKDGRRYLRLNEGSGIEYGSGAWSTYATTDDRGEYRIIWIKPGTYYLGTRYGPIYSGHQTKIYFPGTPDPDFATPIRAGAGVELANIDFSVPKQIKPSTFTVSGNVTGIPASIINGSVEALYIVNRDRSEGDDEIVLSNVSADKANGRFQIRGLVPGEYELLPEIRDEDNRLYTARTVIRVVDRNLDDVVVVVQPGVNLHGRILLDGAEPAGRLRRDLPSDAYSFIESDDGLPNKFLDENRSPVDPMTGEFVISNLISGRYFVQLRYYYPNIYLSDVKQGGRSILDDVITVSNEATLPIELLFRTNLGTVSGTVLDLQGKLAIGAKIVLVPQSSEQHNRNRFYVIDSNKDGTVTLDAAPGDYLVFAWTQLPEGSPWLNADFMSHFQQSGKRITVRAGTTTNVSLTASEVSHP